jgi:hypothetical protein
MRDSCCKSVEEYMSDINKVCESVVDNLERAVDLAKQHAVARKQEKVQKAQQRYQNKMNRFSTLVDRMKEMVDPRWRDFCLERYRDDNFRCGFVQDIMVELMRAPSKGRSKRMLRSLAGRINRAFSMLYEKGCHNFSFLSKSDPFEASLKRALLEMFPSPGDVFRNRSFRLTGLNRVESDGDLLAVVRSSEHPFLLENRIIQGRLRSALIDVTIELAGGAEDEWYKQESRNFAHVLLSKHLKDSASSNTFATTLDFCKSLVAKAARDFLELRPVILCFLQDDATQMLLLARDGKREREAEEWIAQKLRIMNDFIWRDEAAIDILKQRGFFLLRREFRRRLRMLVDEAGPARV